MPQLVPLGCAASAGAARRILTRFDNLHHQESCDCRTAEPRWGVPFNLLSKSGSSATPAIAARRHRGDSRSRPNRGGRRCARHMAGAGSPLLQGRGDDGACYILRNDVMTGRWELTMFDRSGAIG
jgi:hypothetical protein